MSEMENPYKYVGPLDPVKNSLVCASRKVEVRRVIDGIKKGEYWMILGSRQIGKTTFLHLVKNQYKEPVYIYIDFEIAPKREKKFYQWLADKFIDFEVAPKRKFYQWLAEKFMKKIQNKKTKFWTIAMEDPDLSFFDFLCQFRPKAEEKIILMFDEIDKLDFLGGFLHLWRKVYHERMGNKELERYIVITTGSMELLRVTRGPNSPFNIAKTLQLNDLSRDESEEELIDRPLAHLKIEIEPEAKQTLWSQIFGHPQLLQHACFIMVENVEDPKSPLTKENVNKAIKRLFLDNTSLNTLRKDLNENSTLKDIVVDILEGKKILYHPYKYLALLGAGAFKEDKETSLCQIRNPVYKKFIKDILEHPVEETAWKSKEKPKEEEEKEEVKMQELPDPIQPKSYSPLKKQVKIRFWIFFGILCILTAILSIIAVIINNPVLIAGAVIPAMFALGLLQIR